MAAMPSLPPSPSPSSSPSGLLDRWCVLLRRAGATADPVPYGENLIARWSEPHRRHHTTDHLRTVLDHAEELAAHATDPDAVLLAGWFHDAVYRPERSENEERSAALAERALREAGLAGPLTAEVARLVRLTADHDPAPGDRNGELLTDADLADLAGSPERYAAYASSVRDEYAFVPDEEFRAARAEVLRQLLSRPRVFRTPYGAVHWERAARHNVGTELALLSP
ncbi:HD domain-containing protein [Streptomyces sp. SID5468]|nr:HD domain-containing protein [Streptomyces sp. SID5468]